ncbi:beta-glucuronosyltransferase GlcAT14A [Cinnamomum micranthum f. kanehirae]|uniref:Beta-glucuronosyltransferase GlcAT14A n=1 Tax=Cinnamomum micranthum f. kanehirae TaxID=337451 RepID=A0A3S3PR59_9MAGN|nr:beta-glucuronosyltransferase GlcAT14A [Cinnamomum micranthum f. kanehirae]
MQGSSSSSSKETKTLFYLLATCLVSIFFILSFSRRSPPSPSDPHLHHLRLNSSSPPPSIAYLLSGSDSDRLLRLLFSIYHPNNRYLLHLDLSAPDNLRRSLALAVRSVPVFRAAGNVDVVGRPDFANQRGSSALSSTLHGAAILLRLHPSWDWFINLDARDYPLLNQDDLLHVMSFLPRDLNFIQHSSLIGWRESRRIKPIIVDPGLYLSARSDVFYATQKRELPNAYRIFTGSPSVVLSRKFVEFCILGSDNFPRTLLMYYSNTPSSHANYFHTTVCNSREFNKTTVNYNMHYVSWDNPPKRDPRPLGLDDFEKMIESGAAFGTLFSSDDPVLDRIDREVLNRSPGKIAPGGWCLGEGDDPCTVWGDANVLRPGSGAKRFEKAIVDHLSNGTFRSQQCISE